MIAPDRSERSRPPIREPAGSDPHSTREEPMRVRCSWSWLAVPMLAAVALASPALAPRPADAQAGAAVVFGLDQEPPTLDPHASPSAVTYQIIASVTESLLY